MEEVIQKLLASAFGTDLNSKIVNCIKAYREDDLVYVHCQFVPRITFRDIYLAKYYGRGGKGGMAGWG